MPCHVTPPFVSRFYRPLCHGAFLKTKMNNNSIWKGPECKNVGGYSTIPVDVRLLVIFMMIVLMTTTNTLIEELWVFRIFSWL